MKAETDTLANRTTQAHSEFLCFSIYFFCRADKKAKGFRISYNIPTT